MQAALGIARDLDDAPTLAYVLDQGHIATNGPDTAERGLAWAHELIALAETVGDPDLSVRARSWQIDLLLELDDIAGADMAIEALGAHRLRLARPARPRLHPAAPRAAGDDLRAPGGHRAAHPRGHPTGLEPAGLDDPHPRRRAALLAAPRAGARSRARGRGAPVRRSAAGHARLARRAGHALSAHGAPGGGAPRVRPPGRAQLRHDPARQRVVDGDRHARRAL